MKWSRSKTWTIGLLVAFSVVTLSLPTLIIIGASLTAGEIIQFPPDGLSLRWYGELMGKTAFKDALWRTFYVAIVCTALSIPVGVLAAIALMRHRLRFEGVVNVYLLLPFTVPLVVSGISLMVFFGDIRILGQLWPVGVALCLINLPFMIWAVAASARGLDPELENAAANCGARPMTVFFTVTLPAVAPGVITGALLMFILAFNEFLVSLFLTDSRTVTLPVQIYNSIRSIITPDLAAVSVVYIAIALAAVWLLDRLVGLEIFLKSK